MTLRLILLLVVGGCATMRSPSAAEQEEVIAFCDRYSSLIETNACLFGGLHERLLWMKTR